MSAATLELLIIALLIGLNAVLAMAEMAVVSSRKARLEQRANAGDANARAALALADSPTQLLSTVQIGITLVGVLAGAFGGATVSRALARPLESVPALAPYAEGLGVGAVVVGITYLTLIFGELVPKRLALHDPERIAAALAPTMRGLAAVASPAVRLLGASTDTVLRVLRVGPRQEAPITEEEIEILVEQGTRAGVFEQAEQEIIEAVFRLGDRRVSSLMTPRPEVVWLNLEAPAAAILPTVLGSRRRQFPVCRGSLDEVVGVVAARDLLARRALGAPSDLAATLQPALFVPESLHAYRLLERFKQQACQFAVVIDEYGGTQGVITVTDILEALVGDLPTGAEVTDPAVVGREDGSWLVEGMLPIEELMEILGVDALPRDHDGDYATVGGLMMATLGRVPRVGDRFDWDGYRFEVVDMDGNRVDRVLITPRRDGLEDS
jgi:putative hemolysin